MPQLNPQKSWRGPVAGEGPSADEHYIISNEDVRWFWGHHLKGETDKRNPLAAPLIADLRNLSPLLVTSCEVGRCSTTVSVRSRGPTKWGQLTRALQELHCRATFI
jgi:alpha/beta hydrolase fold